jgi:peptidyl-dipeptidase A
LTAQSFLNTVIPRIADLHKASSEAYWRATTSGRSEDEEAYSRSKQELLKLYADKALFAELMKLRAADDQKDPLITRQLTLLYHAMAESQIDEADIEELVRRETEIESLFTNFRATVGERTVSDNEIHDILAHERDNDLRRAAWEGSKQVGALVADKVISLVRFRNAIARKLGYDNFYSMSLTLQEIDEQDLFDLLTRLERLTTAPFAAMKTELDAELSARYGIKAADMRPWHYADPFFQEAPTSEAVDLNRYFADQDVVELSRQYFASIGLPVDDILSRSDLYEREGKNQHAYCIDIDRSGDVRILCNVRSNEYWMSTMLHELGHAVYDRYHDNSLPWLLRQPAHTLTTEAIAMLFGRLTKNADWLHQIAGVDAAEAERVAALTARQLRRAMLIFVRWGLVMTFFERDLYQNPDQDLNTLWWDYVERFQMVTRPEQRHAPDWAAKIHLGTAPVYYQNYILGELTASQLQASLEQDLGLKSLTHQAEIGEWLKNKVFRPGNRQPWNEMIASATGTPLTADHFANQFIS